MKTLRALRKQYSETALRPRDILDSTFDTDKRNTRYVSLVGSEDTPKGWKITTLTKIPGERARSHRVRIEMPPGYHGRFRVCPNVRVDCDCVTGDTQVLTDNGWYEIRALAQPLSDDQSFLPVNYMVNGRAHAGTYPYYKGRAPVYKIQLDNGTTVTATKDHRFLVVDLQHKPVFSGRKRSYTHSERTVIRKWRRLGKLRVGDRLDVNDFSFDIIEQDRTFWEAYFIGVLMGDGSIFNTGYPDLQLHGGKQSLADHIARAEVIADVRELESGVRLAFNARAREVMSRLDFRNKESVKILTLTDLLGYVSGLAATDGKVDKSMFALSIHGGEYLRDLHRELLRFGFGQTRLRISAKKGSVTNYGTRSKDLLELVISGESLVRLKPYLHMRTKSHDTLDATYAGYLRKFGDKPKIAYTRVTAITYAGRQFVYDITVPGVERFVANGVIAHNCGRYLFVWNYALGVHGAAIRDRTNGEAPDITNPSQSPGACKHLLLAMEALVAVNPDFPGRRITTKSHPKFGKAVTLTTLRQVRKTSR